MYIYKKIYTKEDIYIYAFTFIFTYIEGYIHTRYIYIYTFTFIYIPYIRNLFVVLQIICIEVIKYELIKFNIILRVEIYRWNSLCTKAVQYTKF